MSKLVDFVIMLPGNSYILYTNAEQAELMAKAIAEACTPDSTGVTKLWINLQDGTRKAQIRTTSVLGWCIKDHTENLQERVLRKVDQTLDEQNEAESWKHGGKDDGEGT